MILTIKRAEESAHKAYIMQENWNLLKSLNIL